MAGVGQGNPVSSRLKRKLDDGSESTQVFIDGFKLRAGTIPWRCVHGPEKETSELLVEILLIERLNTPGEWTFPAGSLDAGEEVATCAARETQEECGAIGVLGCFLGSYDTSGKKCRSWAYFFSLRVHRVLDEGEGSEHWRDPDKASLRRRRWCLPDAARPLLRKESVEVLDAFLSVPHSGRADPLWRAVPSLAAGGPRIVLLSGPMALQAHCAKRGRLLRVASAASETTAALQPAARFAALGAALCEADVVVAADIRDRALEVGFGLGLSAASRRPVLCICREDARMETLAQGDARVRFASAHGDDQSAWEEACCSALDTFLAEKGLYLVEAVEAGAAG